MNNEREIAKKITAYLDRGSAELKSGTAYRLQVARREALAALAEPEHAAELALAGAGGAAEARQAECPDRCTGLDRGPADRRRSAIHYWQSVQQVRDTKKPTRPS
jgi:hypothetical protein